MPEGYAMREFEAAIDANLTAPIDALWAQRVRGWAELSLPAKRCYLECVLQDVVEGGPLSGLEVERLDSECRDYYFRMMLVWVRGSGMAAVRKSKLDVRRTIVEELEGRAAPRRTFYSWRNKYGGE
jgi:hypothetical protein